MTTTPASALTLPVLDLSLLDGSDAEAARFRDELRRATHEVGFFYLVGHGVPAEFIARAFDTARAFFALPEEDKLAIENVTSPHFRGYTRMGGEQTLGQTDWREQIDIGAERPAVPLTEGVERYWSLEGPNLWPAALPELREVSEEWIARLDAIGTRLLRAWAETLGAPADTFDAAFANSSPHLKIARYPGVDAPEPAQGVGAHKDLGVLTLLYVEEGRGGLQVEKDGAWIDAPPVDGAFVVNIGELLEIATDGYLKATKHRVLSPAPGTERISIPYFHGPALDAEVPTIPLPPELAAEAPGVDRDPANPLHPVFGRNWLKSRVRAHRNVVEAQYPDWLL
ncbi:MAG: 2-oxoglutarate and iron-dependent oxygenase domain-containing protein [Microcella sp.]|uniref:isopenicillin N synthase family dioxygenase n=1 Tax=Microcella sp. TaxID=1913979 RepID=UPI00271C251C|nr:2-oxoglutarate and iron-dependent oxygenase domain-containing protein [Microcella sp.]MDO8336677.1 2-oxoglutarate and iron-dependent oxygenase domain-containing protein [Microcella sp.]